MLSSEKNAVVEQAIEWMVFLRSGEACTEDLQEFYRWRASDPAHEDACKKIESSLGKVDDLATESSSVIVKAALSAPSSRRAFLRNSTMIVVGVGFSALIANQKYPLRNIMADVTTATAERRTFFTEDGTRIEMNARSALNYSFNEDLRLIQLEVGEILVDVTQDARPLIIKTSDGSLLLDSGSLHLQVRNYGTRVSALRAMIRATNLAHLSETVESGNSLFFTSDSMIKTGKTSEAETAWSRGRLEVRNEALLSVVRALRNYSMGYIRVEPDVAQLRVSGNYPLDDVPYTLDALAQTMPISVTQTTPYFVRIGKSTS